MKKIVLMMLSIATLTGIMAGCGQATETKKKESKTEAVVDESTVVIYYFHSKQRCKTCLAVQNVTEETFKESFADNKKVVYLEIDYSSAANEKLADKYEISMSSLLIAKGSLHENLTDVAFANAVRNPEVLKSTIKETINKYINN
jgi:basic membrane lipoprotein Med (substrate-binding protein (PBP1-ABC) superfamily)